MAALPTPSAAPDAVPPGDPPPARTVVDHDSTSIVLIMLLYLSATKRRSKTELAATAKGLEKSADEPKPSAKPERAPVIPPPAAVVTKPVAMFTPRIKLLSQSAMKTLPPYAVMPNG